MSAELWKERFSANVIMPGVSFCTQCTTETTSSLCCVSVHSVKKLCISSTRWGRISVHQRTAVVETVSSWVSSVRTRMENYSIGFTSLWYVASITSRVLGDEKINKKFLKSRTMRRKFLKHPPLWRQLSPWGRGTQRGWRWVGWCAEWPRWEPKATRKSASFWWWRRPAESNQLYFVLLLCF